MHAQREPARSDTAVYMTQKPMRLQGRSKSAQGLSYAMAVALCASAIIPSGFTVPIGHAAHFVLMHDQSAVSIVDEE
jgi:hypothetical protein